MPINKDTLREWMEKNIKRGLTGRHEHAGFPPIDSISFDTGFNEAIRILHDWAEVNACDHERAVIRRSEAVAVRDGLPREERYPYCPDCGIKLKEEN